MLISEDDFLEYRHLNTQKEVFYFDYKSTTHHGKRRRQRQRQTSKWTIEQMFLMKKDSFKLHSTFRQTPSQTHNH